MIPLPASERIQVLLLDDDPDAPLLARESARHSPYQFAIYAATTRCGFFELGEIRPSAPMLVDLVLPGDNSGIAIAQEARGRWPMRLLVGYTGLAMDSEQVREARAVGCFDMIAKKEVDDSKLWALIGLFLEAPASRRSDLAVAVQSGSLSARLLGLLVGLHRAHLTLSSR